MSKILLENEGELQDFQNLLDGLNLEVQKKSKKGNDVKTKILTYNKGYVQYMNKDEYIDKQNHQSKSKLSIEDYIFNHGYLIYKAGVNINKIKNNEDSIKFGWISDENKEYYFNFKFIIKHKIIYNPDPTIQKKQKSNKIQNPEKSVIWQFEVKLENEINQIKNRLAEIEEKKRKLQKYIICDEFIEKYDKMELEIQSSESLEQELNNFKIEVQFLGYISKKLNNTTNRKIVNADIAARSLFIFISKQNEYMNKKMQRIEQMIETLYKGKDRNFDKNVIQIAKDEFQSDIEDSEFAIVDVLLLNALMYHFQFRIDLQVRKLINFTSFFTSLNFQSLSDYSNKTNLILFSDITDLEYLMNYRNFLKAQQSEEFKLSEIERYCVGLFGEENQYLGIFYIQYYQKMKKKIQFHQQFVEFLEKAVRLFEKHLNHSHPKHIEALDLLHIEEQNLENQKNQEKIKNLKMIGINEKDPNQVESQLKCITFESDQSKSTNISRSSQSSEKYTYQIAEENYEKGQYLSAISAIEKIQNKKNKVLKLGFLIEKKLNGTNNNNFYTEKLLNNYMIYGCGVEEYPTIIEILQFQFKNYVFGTKITFKTQGWIQIINSIKNRSFTVEKVQVVNKIIDFIRKYQFNDTNQYFNNLFSKLNPDTKTQSQKQDQINSYLDQFQLISQQYFQTLPYY
ncbi:unnamed protein product [Paramecium pentaurelia]|uniref:Uncharacterized protein n=1 Tax=Paramecium pentaurelia TaxID=43138 RepID=A0A8S1VVK7_9CILI|nr:unnamed protein product [Paramecium pentaurelia]